MDSEEQNKNTEENSEQHPFQNDSNYSIEYENNYRSTNTGKIAEFKTKNGVVSATLYKQVKNRKLQYVIKYKTENGHISKVDKLIVKIQDGMVSFDLNLPADLKGAGIGNTIFKVQLIITN